MPSRKRPDAKLASLQDSGTVNPRPERVTDEAFRYSEFFDARDLVQVKYEMLRRVQAEKVPVSAAARTFGLSRPSFYQAQAALTRDGLAGLLPRKRGPRSGHKLNPEVVTSMEEARAADPLLTTTGLLAMVRDRFGVQVHRRSIERALRRLEKKRP